MFSILESTWGPPARGWSTLVSFTFQALALSLLLLVPLFSIPGPPHLEWSRPVIAPPPTIEHRNAQTLSNVAGNHIIAPQAIPETIAILKETHAPPAPDLDRDGVRGATGDGRRGALDSIASAADAAAPPPRPAALKPLRISHWAEGNLVYRVQPLYPEIARQARIQGAVVLRAVVSKNGTIENLTTESGHPALAAAAINAVKQWRYRPYLLNNEPIEVETEITVNFVLGGN